ncbi:MAG: POTRA domain-containing protein [Aquificota bacterium]|nr:POTRA domain-containing protein [Aquificota bacterium]
MLLSTFAYAKVFLYSNYPLRNNNFQKMLTEENMFVVLWALQKLKDIKDIRVSVVGSDTVLYVERYPILKRVDIEGNRFASDEEIKNLILLREEEPLVDFDPEIASSTLRLFYSRMGFLDAQVHIDLKVDDKGYAYVKVKVKEGELYLFGGAKFDGLKSFSPEKLLQEAELSIGDIFNEERARSAVEKIYSLYRREGFLESTVYFTGVDKRKMDSPFPRALFPGIEGARSSIKGLFITLFKGFSNLLSHPLGISRALLGKGSLAYPSTG